MSKIKTIALAALLIFGTSQLALAQYGSGPTGGGAGTASGHSNKAQNNNRGPGKSTGTGSGTGMYRQ